MDPAFWGRHTWIYLHTLTFNYPSNPTIKDKKKYYNHFNNLGDMLPCPTCATSYKIFFKYIPIIEFLDDIHGITFWLFIIHFLVNKKLSKNNISFYDTVKIYYPNKASCPTPSSTLTNNGKCTAKPLTNLNTDEIFSEFRNIAEAKYLKRIISHIANLIKHHPEFK